MNCLYCDSVVVKRYNKYCNHTCEQAFRKGDQRQKIINGEICTPKVLKAFISEEFGYKCVECGIGDTYNGKPITLQLEHKDGDCSNNKLENLSLLCPNCHSQTPTYGNKNTRTADSKRRMRYLKHYNT
jgi:5-methylcytosine-specific restriction endonuclease McrA